MPVALPVWPYTVLPETVTDPLAAIPTEVLSKTVLPLTVKPDPLTEMPSASP